MTVPERRSHNQFLFSDRSEAIRLEVDMILGCLTPWFLPATQSLTATRSRKSGWFLVCGLVSRKELKYTPGFGAEHISAHRFDFGFYAIFIRSL